MLKNSKKADTAGLLGMKCFIFSNGSAAEGF